MKAVNQSKQHTSNVKHNEIPPAAIPNGQFCNGRTRLKRIFLSFGKAILTGIACCSNNSRTAFSGCHFLRIPRMYPLIAGFFEYYLSQCVKNSGGINATFII